MNPKWLFAIVIILTIFLHGCETAKGAAQGFQKDWEDAKEADKWIQEHLW
ncbi:MAG: hypothetical protein H6755_01790 [Candidatus Omnitrophica bacterium]|nr:hypothetical protein [Candidatus Omnitrophota bacterium]